MFFKIHPTDEHSEAKESGRNRYAHKMIRLC